LLADRKAGVGGPLLQRDTGGCCTLQTFNTADPVIIVRRTTPQAGQPDAASRLVAKAWWAALRGTRPRGAERINGALHDLARLPPEPDAPPTEAPATKENA
jgi:hypothetical protein